MTGPSPHFTWRELGAVDAPPEAQVALAALVLAVLEPLRARIGRPVRVTSGYRSSAANAAIVGASRTSQHVHGEAVDIVVEGLTSRELCRALLDAGIPHDQVIWYDRDRHVHVSYTTRRPNRGECRHATEGGYPREEP